MRSLHPGDVSSWRDSTQEIKLAPGVAHFSQIHAIFLGSFIALIYRATALSSSISESATESVTTLPGLGMPTWSPCETLQLLTCTSAVASQGHLNVKRHECRSEGQ